jgi:methionyl-tRNA synthetase
LKWGIPVPLEGYEKKVFYVWFDAPIGYVSITKHAFPDEWESWWKSDDVLLYQFMAKDNIPFHTILFPSTLIGTRDKWTMLHHIDSTEYLNYEDGKFSKSASQGVFGDDAKSTCIPPDVWRYYLLSNRPEGSDSQFSWKEFQDKNNNELLSNLGNFVNRTLTFVHRYFDSTIPRAKLTERDDKLIVEVGAQEKKIIELLEQVKERDALKEVMHISRLGNQYFQDSAPWTLVKPDTDAAGKERCATIMNVCCNLVRTLAVLVEPFLPNTSKEMFNQLNLNGKDAKLEYKMHLDLKPGHKIGVPKVIFRKLEDKEIAEFKKKFAGKKVLDKPAATVAKLDKFPLDLRVAKVIKVDDHPEAEKLYIVQIDIGSEKRQLVAGMKPYISKEELTGKNIIVVCNLKPAKLRGVESNGMLLAADDGKNVAILEAKQSDPGDEVAVEGIESEEKFKQLEISEFGKISLVIDDNKHVLCENFGKRLKTPFEYIVAKIGKGAKVR